MRRTAVIWLGTSCWLVATGLPLMFWHGWHAAPLPVASEPIMAPAAPVAAVADTLMLADGWRRFHVLQSGCPCSDQMAALLGEREPTSAETILIVDGDSAATAAWHQHGWLAEVVTSQALRQRWGIAGGPWLVIQHGQEVRYRGGYAKRRPTRSGMLADQALLLRLQYGESVDPLPTFGCSFTAEWREKYDPLGLKWSNK